MKLNFVANEKNLSFGLFLLHPNFEQPDGSHELKEKKMFSFSTRPATFSFQIKRSPYFTVVKHWLKGDCILAMVVFRLLINIFLPFFIVYVKKLFALFSTSRCSVTSRRKEILFDAKEDINLKASPNIWASFAGGGKIW